MGAVFCGSSAVAAYTEVQLRELQSGTPVFALLGVKPTSSVAKRLHEAFDHAVDNPNGHGNVRRLCRALEVPPERYYTQSFLCFGNESKITGSANRWQRAARAETERCTFSQYLVGLWNLCTLSKPQGMAVWFYRMHFGNAPGAEPKAIMDILDRKYGISEERDYHANVAKKWYGDDYHRKNARRTQAMIERYVIRDPTHVGFGMVPPTGWLELVKRSPGILQNHIALQKALRSKIIGESFWRRMEKMKKARPDDLRSIEPFVVRVEEAHPGHLLRTQAARDFFKLDERLEQQYAAEAAALATEAEAALARDAEENMVIQGEVGVDYGPVIGVGQNSGGVEGGSAPASASPPAETPAEAPAPSKPDEPKPAGVGATKRKQPGVPAELLRLYKKEVGEIVPSGMKPRTRAEYVR